MTPGRRLWRALPAGLLCAAGLSACNLPLSPGPPPRPTVIVITAEGPYVEPFDSPGSWLIGQTEASIGAVENGEYLLTLLHPSYLAWAHQNRRFGDGVYEVDARFVSGPEASAYGLLLLGSSDLSSFLYVVITDDGRYDIGACQDWCAGQQSLIGGLTVAYAILPGEQSNHLRIELADGSLALSINGAPVSQVSGLNAESGLVGLIGESSQYGGFQAAFDNLQVIEAGLPPPEPAATALTATPVPEATAPPLIEPTPAPAP